MVSTTGFKRLRIANRAGNYQIGRVAADGVSGSRAAIPFDLSKSHLFFGSAAFAVLSCVVMAWPARAGLGVMVSGVAWWGLIESGERSLVIGSWCYAGIYPVRSMMNLRV